MKIIQTASGKTEVRLTRTEWEAIGKKAGWDTEEKAESEVEAEVEEQEVVTTAASENEVEVEAEAKADVENTDSKEAKTATYVPDNHHVIEIKQEAVWYAHPDDFAAEARQQMREIRGEGFANENFMNWLLGPGMEMKDECFNADNGTYDCKKLADAYDKFLTK
jgi:hypothetical protein